MRHELTAGEAGLLVMLFPHLAGLDLAQVALGRRGLVVEEGAHPILRTGGPVRAAGGQDRRR